MIIMSLREKQLKVKLLSHYLVKRILDGNR